MITGGLMRLLFWVDVGLDLIVDWREGGFEISLKEEWLGFA